LKESEASLADISYMYSIVIINMVRSSNFQS